MCQSSSASLDQVRPRRVQTQANLFGDVELVWHTEGVLNTEGSAMPDHWLDETEDTGVVDYDDTSLTKRRWCDAAAGAGLL